MFNKKRSLFWADLHNHNEVGYGKGSLDRSYQIAKAGLLDAYAFTVHGYWPDIPKEDQKIAQYHKDGFEKVLKQWPTVRDKANTENKDNDFVAFVAFEWHSSNCGDYCIIMPGEEGEICAAESLRELQNFVKKHKAIMIPHHIAYKQGWRGINWKSVSSEVSPVAEVFSEHACSMESDSCWPMLLHSMGGVEHSQTFIEQLRKGRIMGVCASTDNHYGHPGSYGEGLTGIWAENLSRNSILSALKKRHCYAVTGDRIGLQVSMADGMMGDIISADTPRHLRYEVKAFNSIEFVKIFKNGNCVDIQIPELQSDDLNEKKEKSYIVRLDFGWGPMTALDTVDWNIRLAIDNGRFGDINPCFSGGAASSDKINGIKSYSEQEIYIEAFTSRLNPNPTSGVALRIDGTSDSRIDVDIEAFENGKKVKCTLSASISELLRKDLWSSISKRFSAPKIRLGHALENTEVSLNYQWTDPEPSENDFYLVKVQQKNGHIAWSSPIWCRNQSK